MFQVEQIPTIFQNKDFVHYPIIYFILLELLIFHFRIQVFNYFFLLLRYNQSALICFPILQLKSMNFLNCQIIHRSRHNLLNCIPLLV